MFSPLLIYIDMAHMDDIKVFAASQTQLKFLNQSSYDINMKFVIDKCAVTKFDKGKLEHMQNIEIDENRIKSLESGKTYRFLGIREGRVFNDSILKDDLRKK